MKIIGVIPARFASSRFPGKPIEKILGKPMIQWVYEGAKQSKLLNKIIVATDTEKIYNTVKGFGGEVKLTSPDAPSGSDRIAEAIKDEPYDIVVNIQGDEPLITGEVIDTAIKALTEHPDAVVGTLYKKIEDTDEFEDPNVVKVVFDKNGYAIYFSRSKIPSKGNLYKHIGIYVYKFDFLMKFLTLDRTALEVSEKLEQLRIIENGFKIGVGEITKKLYSVDTKADLLKVEKYLKENSNEKS
jgi:3-deoxy-manno-octulosonate cytidylyltransferase (CMP-KDO synthetase)